LKTFTTFVIKVKNSFGFLPAAYSIVAIVFALLTINTEIWLEESSIHHQFPEILLTDRSLAQLILSSLASSILTVTAITFSTIMVVLTTYLSQYSPRTIDNFLSDQTTRRVLAVFVSSFVYFLLVLLWMKTSEPSDYIMIPSIAVLVGIVNLGFFVYFIHHVALFIQVINLIKKVTENTIQSIEIIYEEYFNTGQQNNAPWNEWELEEVKQRSPKHYLVQASGYIQVIDINRIIKQAQRDEIIIKMEKHIGDYVDQDSTLFSYWKFSSNDLYERVYIDYFTIGNQRSTEQDIEYGIQKLTEIGLRAISPGINDPYTAITCIHRLGGILARLGRLHVSTPQYYDNEKNLRFIMKQKDFMEYLYKGFYQLRQYGSGDVSVIAAILDSLIIIAENNDSKIKSTIWKFSIKIISGVQKQNMIDLDLEFLSHKLEELANVTEHKKEFQPISFN
jgi:uncharacterized membrane protein